MYDFKALASGERTWLAGVLALLLAAHLVTLTRLPIVAIDEVSYSDPGVNLALGQGFVSTAWYSQTADSFFAGNTPLYPLLLGGWLKILGFSMTSVRLLNVVLCLVALFIAWVAVGRLEIVGEPGSRILFVLLLGTGTGMVFSCRFGRYDTLMLLLFLLAALAASVRSPALRLAAMGALGIVFPFAGLPLVAYTGVLWVLLFFFVGRRVLWHSAATALGIVVGLALLYCLYRAEGVWATFRSSVSPHIVAGWRCPELDPSAWVVVTLLCVWNVSKIHRGTWHPRSLPFFALVAGVVIPVGISALGKYPLQYSWMAYVPMAACLCGALERQGRPAVHRFARLAISAALLVAVMVGLPAYVAIVALEWRARDYGPVDRLAARHVRPSDSVYCDWGAYYAAKSRAASVVLPTYAGGWEGMRAAFEGAAPIPAEQRSAVTLLMVNPERSGAAARVLGGTWVDTGDEIGQGGAPVFSLPMGRHLGSVKYNLKAYRRASPP